MGGVLILIGIFVSCMLWADLSNRFIWIVMIVTFGFGAIGWVDDYRKVARKDPKGMASKEKFFWQTVIGLFAAIPAVVAYNRAATDVDRLAIRFETFIEEFTNILQRQTGR